MIAQFEIIPIGDGTSMSDLISQVINKVDASGLEYKLTSMGTIVEGEWDKVMQLIKDCHDELMQKVDRTIIHITIDDRKGKTGRIEGKIRAVEEKLGRQVHK